MKSKFMAGFMATLICLFLVIGAAIFITSAVNSSASNGVIKIVAGVVIFIWLGLYNVLKPKQQPVAQSQPKANETESEPVEQNAPKTENKSRNSYN